VNGIFFAIILVAFGVTAWHELHWAAVEPDQLSPMVLLGANMIETAGGAVTLAIGLVGVMALFLGIMKIAEGGGLLTIIAKTIRPLMIRLFPDVPHDHPAMGAMVLNFSANALGLGNAATPFGIRAMQELDKLNPHKGTATNAMVMFLVINTASITILPTSVVALRAAAGSAEPAAIVPTTLFATIVATAVAILCARLLQRFWTAPKPDDDSIPGTALARADEGFPEGAPETSATVLQTAPIEESAAYPIWISWIVLAGLVALIPLTVFYGRIISPWIIPGLMAAILVFGFLRKVRVYEAFVEGAKDGFRVAVRIIPYLVAILVAIGMLRTSGALDAIIDAIAPFTETFGLPAEALPMAIMRSLSGSGAYGIMASIMNDPTIGPDSYVGLLVSTIQGSSETTFYVLAVYCGAVQVRRMRHAVAAGLIADVAAILAAAFICSLLFPDGIELL
jgi:spore maturation protein SpmA